jgi:urease accessory protein
MNHNHDKNTDYITLLSLLQLSDPALPIGSYAHSAGLETYVQQGIVHDPATACEWITQMLGTTICFTDAALLSLAHEATRSNDPARLARLNTLAEAVKLPKEIRESSRLLGRRLLAIFNSHLNQLQTNLHYPVAFGWCAATLGITLSATLTGFYYNTAAAMVTNCVKLIPIGQQDGQRILFHLHPLINSLIEKSLVPDEHLIGLCCPGPDIRCMQHEQLYSRLYMS